MKFAAWDIEIAKIVEPGSDWKTQRPFGISCAALAINDQATKLFYRGQPNNPEAGAMTKDELWDMFYTMKYYADCGFNIASWNGASFDFDVLSEELDRDPIIGEMCMAHIDPMFQFLCKEGYPVGLNAVSKGMGFAGKTEGMHGDLAPAMWANSLDDRNKVLEYVKRDVEATLEIVSKLYAEGSISWITKKNVCKHIDFSPLFTVRECLAIPEPDISWMGERMVTRESALKWIK